MCRVGYGMHANGLRSKKSLSFVMCTLLLCGLLLSCKSKPSEPTLQETIEYMQRSLKVNFGESAPLSADSDVKRVESLKLNGCKLYRESTNYEATEYDLSDIDISSIKLEKIGDAWWVTFTTRNFNRSIRTVGLIDKTWNHTSDTGGFALNTKDTAEHFSKAVAHAVALCGGKPSSF